MFRKIKTDVRKLLVVVALSCETWKSHCAGYWCNNEHLFCVLIIPSWSGGNPEYWSGDPDTNKGAWQRRGCLA